MLRPLGLQDHSNSARTFLWSKRKYFWWRICTGLRNDVFYIHSFHHFPPEESWWETRQKAPPALVNSITLLKSRATTQYASTPTNPGTAQRRMQRPSPKRVTQTYHHLLPSWLGTRTLYIGTSFIWDSNYCTNIDYHLKCAAQMDYCLWIAVIVVICKKSHFLARYGVNPQGSWTMGTRSSFWKEPTVSTG